MTASKERKIKEYAQLNTELRARCDRLETVLRRISQGAQDWGHYPSWFLPQVQRWAKDALEGKVSE